MTNYMNPGHTNCLKNKFQCCECQITILSLSSALELASTEPCRLNCMGKELTLFLHFIKFKKLITYFFNYSSLSKLNQNAAEATVTQCSYSQQKMDMSAQCGTQQYWARMQQQEHCYIEVSYSKKWARYRNIHFVFHLKLCFVVCKIHF